MRRIWNKKRKATLSIHPGLSRKEAARVYKWRARTLRKHGGTGLLKTEKQIIHSKIQIWTQSQLTYLVENVLVADLVIQRNGLPVSLMQRKW